MTTLKRIKKEIEEFNKDPPKNILISRQNNLDFFHLDVSFFGLEGSPYEGGNFNLKLSFPTDYPHVPFKIKFTSKIFHPNIRYNDGSIDLDIISWQWSPALTIRKVLPVIYSLLIYPNINETSYNLEAFLLFEKNKYEYYKKTREVAIKSGNCQEKDIEFYEFYFLKGMDRINYELNNFENNKNISITKFKDYKLKSIIIGPKNSIYEGKKLNLEIDFSKEYPMIEPNFIFTSKIKDIYINKNINLCKKILKEKLNNKYTIKDLFNLISESLTYDFIYDKLIKQKEIISTFEKKIKERFIKK